MHEAVTAWMSAGAHGLAHQPMSGVPYKVFVAVAPDAGVGPVEFAVATLRYRAPRIVVVAAVTAAIAGVAWRCLPQRWHARVHVGASVLGTAVLLAGLALVVRSWS